MLIVKTRLAASQILEENVEFDFLDYLFVTVVVPAVFDNVTVLVDSAEDHKSLLEIHHQGQFSGGDGMLDGDCVS